MAPYYSGQIRRPAGPHHPRTTRAGAKGRAAPIPAAGRSGIGSSESLQPQGFFSFMKAIADTGLLVAFGNRTDRHHHWAVEIARQVTEPLLTCDAVLAEASFHLGSAALVLAFVREGLVRPAFVLTDHIPRLAELAERYADRA